MIGVNFDGSGRHVISTKTDGLSVSLTRDGEHVVYSFWGASGADADATHVNSFAGIAERLLIDPAVEKSYYSKTGLFIPGDDAKQLLYGFLADGAVYRSLETEPAILVNWWGGRLLDADDDLQTVLTESTVNPWIGELTCYTSRFEEDSDKDGLGASDAWQNLSESIKGDGKGTEFSAAPPTQTTAVFYRVILE